MKDIKTHFSKAMQLQEEGHLSGAEDLYRDILKISPEYTPAMNMLGILLARKGQYSSAINLFKSAISIAPGNIKSIENLARTYVTTGQLDQAKILYEQILAVKPDYFNALSGLASVLMAQNNLSGALQILFLAQSLDPDRPRLYLNIGVIHMRMNQFDKAEENFKRAVKLDQNIAEGYVCLGDLHTQTNNFPLAEKDYLMARKLGVQSSGVEVGLAISLVENGKEEQAKEHYYRAVELNPSSQSAYIGLDIFLLRSGTDKKAFLKKSLQDYVYKNCQESVEKARELAAMYQYPNNNVLSLLKEFFENYNPGELHSPLWWREHLSKFGSTDTGHDKVLRSVHSSIYSWSLPDRDTLSEIARFVGHTRLYSYGAGTGYWEWLLQEHFHVDVIASDRLLRHRFLPMLQEDYANANVSRTDSIFLSWIERGNTAVHNILRQLCTGQRLIIIGEPPSSKGLQGICGSPELFNFIDTEFRLEKCIRLTSYSLLNDTASLYVKNETIS